MIVGSTRIPGPFDWVVEEHPNAGLITDANGVIKYVNPAFEALTGCSRDEVIGQPAR